MAPATSKAPAHSPPVPHAAHFLERLDRVPRSLSDFALGLYRDEERVRWIVHYAHLPEGEERVAFALDPDGEGPYIVVTRQGKFVTALGAEMRPKNLTILSRAQVDAFSARVHDARSRFELAKDVVPPGKPPEDVLRLLTARAWALSREQLSAIAAWTPLMAIQFLKDIFEPIAHIETIRETFLTVRDKKYRNAPLTKTGLDMLWNATFGTGARYVLATMGDLAFAEHWGRGWKFSFGPTHLATAERVHSVAMRGAWAAARMGKSFVHVYKSILSTPGDQFHRFDAALAMTAIGIRHAKLREEARRSISAMVDSAYEWNRDWARSLVAASERAFEDPEGATGEVAAFGAGVLAARGPSLPEGSPFKYARAEDVPRDLALLVAANNAHDSIHSFAFLSLPWVARLAGAEELYYPEGLERVMRIEWTPEQIEAVYARRRESKPKPATRERPRVGRNEPCSCGSERKFKRCCGQ